MKLPLHPCRSRALAVFGILPLVLCMAISATGLQSQAQDVRGWWSGHLADTKDQYVVLRIAGADADRLTAAVFLDDRGTDIPVDTVSMDHGQLELNNRVLGFHYEATLSHDGSTLQGRWLSQKSSALVLRRITAQQAWPSDHSPHRQSFVEAERGVELEVLDWGGDGPPALLLTGLGNNAHVFDTFAPKLTQHFHVYGLTRRGLGESSWPPPEEDNYTADRLGEDVVSAIRALHLDRPLLIGHSIAGEELTYLGTVHADAIRGLVYLDAGYAYAYFDEAHPDFTISLNEVRRNLGSIRVAVPPQQLAAPMRQLADHDLPRFEPLLRAQAEKISNLPKLDSPPLPPPPPSRWEAIINGERRFAAPRCAVLAIYALGDDAKRTTQYADAFAAAAPQAKVVRLEHAGHYVFKTNEADVLSEIQKFAATLH